MLNIKKEGIILEKTSLVFENEGVLNPAVIRIGDDVHFFYRAVSQGNYSSIGYCRSNGPLNIVERLEKPILSAEFDYEIHGIEDPRIVKIDNLYYLNYTAFDGHNAIGCWAVSEDMVHFEKKGIMVALITYKRFNRLAGNIGKKNEKYDRYNNHYGTRDKKGEKILLWDKNVIFFPRKINGKFCFLHRIKPDVQIVTGIERIEDLDAKFWEEYFRNFDDHILLAPKYKHEASYVGGGCPPIETKEGWLVIYHGVHDSINGYVYTACASLLDLENPQVEIARLPYPLFRPEHDWELTGEVNNVCFPSGAAVFDDILYIYYGAADERIACASVNLTELIDELLLNKKQDEN